jgi:hypothetical protein
MKAAAILLVSLTLAACAAAGRARRPNACDCCAPAGLAQVRPRPPAVAPIQPRGS